MFASEAAVNRAARWLSATLLAGTCWLVQVGGVRPALAETFVDVQIAPPAPRVEVMPRRPSPRHLWIRGYWGWDGAHHVWVPGHYVLARRGYIYVEPRWEAAGRGHWHWRRGGWHRH